MGTLYVVATPIGNLEDVSLRALRVLREVTLIAAEDTRHSRRLLQRYEIKTPVTSYFEHNKLSKLDRILQALGQGDVALISDAGTPGLSDPGHELIAAAVAQGIPVVTVPGPAAPVAALVVSGLPADSFVYLGFLPRKRVARRQFLDLLARETRTLVCFEAPHRLREALTDLAEVFGDRPVAVARELTKAHEEIWRGTLTQAHEHFNAVEPRGEFTLVIGGASQPAWSTEQVKQALSRLGAEGNLGQSGIRELADVAGWPKRDVYRVWLDMK